MTTLLCTASPYGYGPASNLVAVVNAIPPAIDVHLAVDADIAGYVRSSLTRPGTVEVVDRERWWSGEATQAAVDGLLAVHEPRASRWAARRAIPDVFVDSIAWMRSPSVPLACEPGLYLWQRFFSAPDDDALSGLPRHRPVAPILSDIPSAGDLVADVDVCVNLGGMVSPHVPVGTAREYAEGVVRTIGAVARRTGRRMLLCGPGAVVHSLTTAPGVAVAAPAHHEFRAIAAAASTIVTVPGLEVVLESLATGQRIVFLPALNGTQVLQDACYRAHQVGTHPFPAVAAPAGEDLVALTRRAVDGWAEAFSARAAMRLEDALVAASTVTAAPPGAPPWMGRGDGAREVAEATLGHLGLRAVTGAR